MQEIDKTKQKILFVITKSVWGGAGKYVYDLAINLPQEDFEISVAAGGEGKLTQKLKSAGIPYYEVKNFQREIRILSDFFAFFEILKLLKKLKPDIVHTNSSKAGGIAGAAALIYKLFSIFKLQATSYKLQAIFTAHGWAFNESRPKWQIFLIKFFSRLTCLFYDKIICVSEFDRQSAVKNKIAPANKLTTIHNGIDADEYKFLTKEEAIQKISNFQFPISNSSIVVGTIGEFTKNKGQKYLINAIKQLRTTNCELRTIIIGWGEEISNVASQISNLGLENQIFLIDNLSPAAPYLKAFDIFVLPSLKEGLSYTLLEAGLAELPVIATNVGGNPEIIANEKTGILINPANSQEIANAIKILIKNSELAKNLAVNLREKIVQEFSLKKMLKETLKLYSFYS